MGVWRGFIWSIRCAFISSLFRCLFLCLLNVQTVAPLALIFAWTGANFKGYTMKVRIFQWPSNKY